MRNEGHVVSRGHSPGQPKVIYKMKRSEWDLLLEANQSKRKVVHQYRHEIENLDHAIHSLQQSADLRPRAPEQSHHLRIVNRPLFQNQRSIP